MKWYFALNEGGTQGDIALHTKLAVLSARKNTTLEPHLLYTGQQNRFTEWLVRQDVKIIQSELPYLDTILGLVAENRYSPKTIGHWLRTNVCLEEKADTHVFYTDVDVSFLHNPYLGNMRPGFFSAAPEFDPSSDNYFNAGVMLANVEGLRSDYPVFQDYLIRNIKQKTYSFHDQIAYNEFYRSRWNRLPVELNWKPYWGLNENAALIHFHGPKIAAISAILDGRWDHSSSHGAQIGSLFAHNTPHYSHYLKAALENAPCLPTEDADMISHLIEKIPAYDPTPAKGDLSFMKFRMFSDDKQSVAA
jgi:hypothetical protein